MGGLRGGASAVVRVGLVGYRDMNRLALKHPVPAVTRAVWASTSHLQNGRNKSMV